MRWRVIFVAVSLEFFLRKRFRLLAQFALRAWLFRLLGSIRHAKAAISPWLNTPLFWVSGMLYATRKNADFKPFKSSEECFNFLREWAQKWK